MEKSEKKAGRQGLMRRFIPYFGRYKGVLVFDLFCAALTTVCELVLPMLVRYITDMGINNLAALTVATVLKIGGLYLFLRLAPGLKRTCALTCSPTCKSYPLTISTTPRWGRL